MNNAQSTTPLPVRLLSILLIVFGILLLLFSARSFYSAVLLKNIGAQVLLGPNAEPLSLISMLGVIFSAGLIICGFGLRRMQRWSLYFLTVIAALYIATTAKDFNPTEAITPLISILIGTAFLSYLWVVFNRNKKHYIAIVMIILIVSGAAGWLYGRSSTLSLPIRLKNNVASPSPDLSLLDRKYTDTKLGFSIQPPKGWAASQEIGIQNAETICSPSNAEYAGCLVFSRRPLNDLGELTTLTIDQIIKNREQEAQTLPDTLSGNKLSAATDKGLIIFSKKFTDDVVKQKVSLGSVEGYLISAVVKASPLVKKAPRMMILAVKNGQQYMLEYDPSYIQKEIAEKNAAAITSAFSTFQIE